MYTLTVRFTLPPGTDWKAIRDVARQRGPLYAGLQGLHAKAFVIDEGSREYGGNYVWKTREDVDAFLRSDLFAGAVSKFGAPAVRIHEVACYVENGVVVPHGS